jgi:predicted DNA-binding ribbon-helix-helix protein
MKSLIVKHSVIIGGHKTSVSLEEPFWKVLKEIAALRNMPLSNLVALIDVEREHANLSSAIRLFILEFCRGRVAEMTTGRDVAADPRLSARHSVPKSEIEPTQTTELM